jgi:hypothetical protein
MRYFLHGWLWLLSFLAAFEAWAIVRSRQGDTLSEFVWIKTQALPMRAALGGLLVWLVYHWLFAPNGKLGANDIAAAVLGIVIGCIAYTYTQP